MKTLLLSILICLIISSCHDISFDSEKWKNWEESESNMRMRLDMTNDLITNYDLVGKSLTEIEELLGEPEKECNHDNCRIGYNLGPCRDFGIAYGVLSIRFKDGKVIEVDKHCH